jgi:D-proline reductase (dithiol) PrdB
MPQNTREVDAFRFTGRTVGSLISQAIEAEKVVSEVPWAPFEKPLSEAKVALLTTAGVSMKGQPAFDMEGEQKRPTWGDPTWRAISQGATSGDVEINHLHIDTGYAKSDLNVALPMDCLQELADAGRVGGAAETHYSIMGFQGNDPMRVVRESAEPIYQQLRDERVDILALAPV